MTYQDAQSAVTVGGTTTTTVVVATTVEEDVVTTEAVSGNPNSVIVKVGRSQPTGTVGQNFNGTVVPETTVTSEAA